MYCRNCGSKLKENAKFCGECGWKIEDVTESEIISDEERPQKKKGVKKIILPVILMVILLISVVVVIYLKQQSTKENLLGNTSSQNLDESTETEKNKVLQEDIKEPDNENVNENEEEQKKEEEGDATEIETMDGEIPLSESEEQQKDEQDNIQSEEDEDGRPWDDDFQSFSIQVSSQSDSSAKIECDGEHVKWSVSTPDCGIGETVTIKNLNPGEPIEGIGIDPWDWESKTDYQACSAPSELLVSAGEYEESVEFSDCVEECDAGDDLFGTMMSFNEPIYADEITIQIKNVRKGTENEKLCKTTIYFYRSK